MSNVEPQKSTASRSEGPAGGYLHGNFCFGSHSTGLLCDNNIGFLTLEYTKQVLNYDETRGIPFKGIVPDSTFNGEQGYTK
jgi:hypothetical protein